MLTVKMPVTHDTDDAERTRDVDERSNARRLSVAADLASQCVEQKHGDKTYLSLNALPTFV